MALTNGVLAVCREVKNNFDTSLTRLQGFQQAMIYPEPEPPPAPQIYGPLQLLQQEIAALNLEPPTPVAEMTFRLNEILNESSYYIPNLANDQAYNDVVDMMQNCSFLEGNPNFSTPLAVVSQLGASMTASIKALIDRTLVGLPELSVGNSLDSFLSMYSIGQDFTTLIPGMDKALQCMSAICHDDIESRIIAMEDVMNNLFMLDTGAFSIDAAIDSVGVSIESKLNLTTFTTTTTDLYGQINTAVTEATNFFKTKM